MNRLLLSFTLSLSLIPVSSAFAQWQFDVEAGGRYVRMIETATNGERLVREQGWLPGLGVAARYKAQDWQWGIVGELYRNDITYSGRLQSGPRFTSETQTTQQRVGVEVSKQLTSQTQWLAGIEYDIWRRHIHGLGRITGLQERYTSWHLLTGLKSHMFQFDTGTVDMNATIVFARPEKLRVRFEQQRFDDVELRTKSATGLRLGIHFQPAAQRNLNVALDVDWIKIGRSDNAVLNRNGVAAGTVAQPSHTRSAIGLRVRHQF